MAAWWDEDERELWMLEYERARAFVYEDAPLLSVSEAVEHANTALAEARACGIFTEDEESFEALRTETVQDAVGSLRAMTQALAVGALDARAYLTEVYEVLQNALAEEPLEDEEEETDEQA